MAWFGTGSGRNGDETPGAGIATLRPGLLVRAIQGLTVAACLGFVALQAGHGWSSYDTEVTQRGQTQENLARSLVQHAEDSVRLGELALSGLVRTLEDAPNAPSVPPLLYEQLREQVARSGRLHGLSVYGETGHWLASSLMVRPAEANNADRAYFQYHRQNPGTALHIGRPVQSRSTGEWVMTLTRRYDYADGDFAGIVLASITIDYFAGFYANFRLDPGSTVALLNTDGTLLARFPPSDRLIGSSFANGRLFTQDLPRAPGGVVRYPSPIDGVMRISGYRQGERYPLLVLVSSAEQEMMAAWRRSFQLQMGFVAAIALVIGLVGFRLAHAVHRRQLAEARLLRLAETDALTGLANRRHFDATLAREWRRAAREDQPLSLLLVDIDHFKLLNDHYGHLTGDACLRQVAEVLAQLARRPADLAARYGGEEFAMILPQTTAAGALQQAGRLQAGVLALALPHERSPLRQLTVSIGCATILPGEGAAGPAPEALVAMADAALYRAKGCGRNAVLAFEPERPGAPAPARLAG